MAREARSPLLPSSKALWLGLGSRLLPVSLPCSHLVVCGELISGLCTGTRPFPGVGWVPTTCSALWGICACSHIQLVGWFLLQRAVQGAAEGLSVPAGSHCRDPSSRFIVSFSFNHHFFIICKVCKRNTAHYSNFQSYPLQQRYLQRLVQTLL